MSSDLLPHLDRCDFLPRRQVWTKGQQIFQFALWNKPIRGWVTEICVVFVGKQMVLKLEAMVTRFKVFRRG